MNDDIPIGWLFAILGVLILLSAFFSSSETGMMSINRYRLSHLARQKDKAAQRVSRLLSRPDRLIGVILIGNNFVNNFAASIATIIAMHLVGETLGPAVATITLTIVVLIFAEVTPKTMAALYPERIAFPASTILGPLLKLFYPLVWLVNAISNGILALFGMRPDQSGETQLTREELRTVVHEAGSMIPRRHQAMLLSILDLENVTVDDIMIPRQEVVGIDLEHGMDSIIEQLKHSQHTRIPVYKGDINNIVGILHLRGGIHLLSHEHPTKAMLMQESREPYFIPESTPLHTQLLNFQNEKRRIGVVVDEYGDVQGIVTLEDILEEIVGEFTTDMSHHDDEIQPQPDGSVLIDGMVTIREMNKQLGWELSTKGPKTLNGLLLEYLESIPDGNICIELNGRYLETLEVKENLIKKIRLMPSAQQPKRLPED